MYYVEAFSRLGIPITKDIPSIKKAYQNLAPRYHPEEDPERFMQLHDAYKSALAYAQGKNNSRIPSHDTFRWPSDNPPVQKPTGYDGLFADLDEKPAADTTLSEKDILRELLWLKLHWLPIPLGFWRRFFRSEAFLLCRGEEEHLDILFELVLGKVHTYGVFRFLLSRLWELESWQTSEGLEVLANKTRKCIAELRKQYSHYLKQNPTKWTVRWVFPLLWYFEALPFLFRLLVNTLLIPAVSSGSVGALLLLLSCSYAVDVYIWHKKKVQQMGRYHPLIREKKTFFRIKDPGMVLVFILYGIIIHFCICNNIMLNISGLSSSSLLP